MDFSCIRLSIQPLNILVTLLFLINNIGCKDVSDGVNAINVAETCAESELVAQCPLGTMPEFKSAAASQCTDEQEQLTDEMGSVIGTCAGTGECSVLCVFASPCVCGVDRITTEGVFCVSPCTDDSACGNGICEVGENPADCEIDCGSRCTEGSSRCNGATREVCTATGVYESVLCPPDTICVEIDSAQVECQTSGQVSDMEIVVTDMELVVTDMGMGRDSEVDPVPDAGVDDMTMEETMDTGVTEEETEIVWISITSGNFMMGSADGEGTDIERPQHMVTTPSFDITKTEITVAQYQDCVEAFACTAPQSYIESGTNRNRCNSGREGYENYPINCVTWYQARSFAEWVGGDLPSEAIWEFVARSGSGYTYPWGSMNADCTYAVMNNSDGYACGELEAQRPCSRSRGNSEQDLCDLAGNLFEWTIDDWVSTYDNASSTGVAYCAEGACGTDINKVVRGGSWKSDYYLLRAAFRRADYPGQQSDEIGFRVVKNISYSILP